MEHLIENKTAGNIGELVYIARRYVNNMSTDKEVLMHIINQRYNESERV